MPSAIARVTDEALKAPIPDKIKPIPRKVRHALDLMFRGECRDIKAAAAQANLSREHLSRSLRLPHIQAFIARKSRENIAIGQIQASNRIVDLIHATSEHVSLDASKHVLAIEGIRPPDQGQVSVNVGVSVGYIVDLTGSHQSSSDAPLTHATIDHE